METHVCKVVIVDGDPMVSYISREYVQRDPRFRVVGEFSDGREALRFLMEHPADLLLVELLMPEYSGRQLLLDLIENEIEIDVLPVTAARDGESLRSALHLGAVDYVMKPFTYERLREGLKRYLQRARVAEGLKTADQETVDHLLHFIRESVHADAAGSRAERVMDCFRGLPGRSFTAAELAQKLGLSVVTVRRYLKRLTEAGRIVSDIDYNTGGHPCIVYRLPERG